MDVSAAETVNMLEQSEEITYGSLSREALDSELIKAAGRVETEMFKMHGVCKKVRWRTAGVPWGKVPLESGGWT